MDATGVGLLFIFILLILLALRAAIRFYRRGGTSRDLAQAAEVLKWYEQTPGG
jgi:hypothetical protein